MPADTKKSGLHRIMCDENNLRPAEELRANAAFVVRVVNSHDELVKAGRELLEGLKNADILTAPVRNLKAAIAKSEAL